MRGFSGKGQHRLPFSVFEPAIRGKSRAAEIYRQKTPFGGIELHLDGESVRSLNVVPESGNATDLPAQHGAEAIRLIRQIQDYLQDPRQGFCWPLPQQGTPYQKRVWAALRDIPAGEVRTYGELARLLDSGPRAVAGACRTNPFALIIPCHRIVGSASLGGYCGYADGPYLEIKRWLLAHEGWSGMRGDAR